MLDLLVAAHLLDTVPVTDAPLALEALADALAHHTTNEGVRLDAATWITTGTATRWPNRRGRASPGNFVAVRLYATIAVCAASNTRPNQPGSVPSVNTEAT